MRFSGCPEIFLVVKIKKLTKRISVYGNGWHLFVRLVLFRFRCSSIFSHSEAASVLMSLDWSIPLHFLVHPFVWPGACGVQVTGRVHAMLCWFIILRFYRGIHFCCRSCSKAVRVHSRPLSLRLQIMPLTCVSEIYRAANQLEMTDRNCYSK